MLGASGVQMGKYIMQAAAGCLGSETDRCNVCNIGLCPKGITSQDPRLYRRLDPEKVAERLVDVYQSFDTELKKIVAPLGRSTSLPIGMSDALGIADKSCGGTPEDPDCRVDMGERTVEKEHSWKISIQNRPS